MTWPPPLFLHADHLPWSLDATTAALGPDVLAALPWQRVFDEMDALVGGSVANPDEGRQVGHYWLRNPASAPDLATAEAIDRGHEATRDLAVRLRSGAITNDAGERFTDVLHIGIGGSALGPQLLIDALGEDTEGKRRGLPLHFIDNTDPDGVSRALSRLGARLRTTLVVVVSKSGGTAEPNLALLRARQAFAASGVDIRKSLVAITVPGSKLDRLASEEGWLARLPLWDWVGGRFSLFSAVGLFPATLAGIDAAALLHGARAMDDWTANREPLDNPAAVLAGIWFVLGGGTGSRDLVVLPYADRLEKLGRYLQQLVMESLGKRLDLEGRVVHQGLTVYGNKGSTDQHAFVQQLRDGRDDTVVTFVQVLEPTPHDPEVEVGLTLGDQLQGFLLGTRRAMAEADRPTVTLTVPVVDEAALAGLVALLERAVGFYASLIRINAYHQPGVEAGKKAAGMVLALSHRLLSMLGEAPQTVASLAAATGSDPAEVFHLLERLRRTGRARVDGSPLTGTWRV